MLISRGLTEVGQVSKCISTQSAIGDHAFGSTQITNICQDTLRISDQKAMIRRETGVS